MNRIAELIWIVLGLSKKYLDIICMIEKRKM